MSQCYWDCGGLELDDISQCKCGKDVWTKEKLIEYNVLDLVQCCGQDTCYRDDNGNIICPDGVICNTMNGKPWNCGDVRITQNTCQCGSISLDFDQYRNNYTWCCPSEPCIYQDDGTALCPNATILQGTDKGCDGGVCYDRRYLSCKSGNQCVRKGDICHGAPPLCKDGSDCDPEKDQEICIYIASKSKCPTTDISTNHQECYESVTDKNNQVYDCITRGDETNEDRSSSETIDYASITPCITITGVTGLMCGKQCLNIDIWCNLSFGSYSCTISSATSDNTTFTSINPILCQNRIFWQNINCDVYYGGRLFSVGHRCTGRQQQCYYPESPNPYMIKYCEDHSDQILSACSQEIDKENPDQCHCHKTKDDEKSYFPCPVNKTIHCIHPELVCDGHAACDNSEDEVLNQECIEKLTKLKTIKPEATKVCTSKMYADKNMKIVAVACDGVEECLDGEDEGWLCTNSKIPFYGTMFVCIMLLLFLIIYKLHKGTFNETLDDSESLVLSEILDDDNFERNHGRREFRDEINLLIQKSKVLDSKKDRILKNKKLYDLESKVHGGSIAEIRLCLKNTLEWSNAKILIEDAFPGFVRKNLEFVENFLERLDKQNLSYWILNKVKTIFNIYLDICKDTILVITIIFIIGGPTSLYYFPTRLTSVVVYCFMATIIIPLVCSSFLHTQRQLKNQKEMPLHTRLSKYFQSFLLSPLRPLLLAESNEENKGKRKSLIKFDKNRDIVLRLNQEGRKLSKNYSEFVRVDLGLEVVFQLSGQILYLLLSSTNTPTTGGLEVMFQKTSDAFLVFSIIQSVKTIYFVTLKTISIVKPFLPFTTKMVLLCWIIISASQRVMAIVLFFTPSFGLFSILGHWQLEQTPYSSMVNERFKGTNTVYLYKTKPFAWTDLNRYNYTSDSGPDYTLYTYYSLTDYFFGFWILLFLHTYTNLLVKIAFSEDFRKKWTSSKLAKFIHCLENINIPSVWKDWDEKDGSIEDHKRRHGQVVKEMVAIMIIRTVFHSLMLAPMVYTG